jgi:hypothetical protein
MSLLEFQKLHPKITNQIIDRGFNAGRTRKLMESRRDVFRGLPLRYGKIKYTHLIEREKPLLA